MYTKITILIIAIFFSFFCNAQDLIVTNEGDSLNCKITKETPENIYFTFKYNDEVRNTLISVINISSMKKNFYSKTEVLPSQVYGLKDYKPVRFSINFGYSYHIAKLSDDIPSDFEEYAKKLKSGFHFGTELNYYFSESTGMGLKYYFNKSSNSMDNIYVQDNAGNREYGKMSDDIKINFLGPALSTRFFNFNKQNCFITSIGLGYLGYKNNKTIIDDFEIKGSTAAMIFDIGYDWGLSEKMAIGFQVSLITGSLRKLEISGGGITETIELEEGEYENLSRIDFTVGIRFLK